MKKRFHGRSLLAGWVVACMACGTAINGSEIREPRFTPLVELPAPRVMAHAEAYPGSMFSAENLVDGWGHTEFATNGRGLETFVDFDFHDPVRVIGFRHQDRRDVATVVRSELLFSNQPDFAQLVRREEITHVDQASGISVAIFDSPAKARYVRWQVTELNADGHQCVGGAEIRFLADEPAETSLGRDRIQVQAVPAVLKHQAGPRQPIKITVDHVYAEPAEVRVRAGDLDPVPLKLNYGTQTLQLLAAAVEVPTEFPVTIELDGQPVAEQKLVVQPVRPWHFYFLPHSHVDIGYTHVQTEVERLQWDHLEKAIQIARDTADYPEAARFKWNVEVLWAVDSYLAQADEQQKADFLAAVRRGWIHLDGLYGNELTALCRPEELMQLTACARRISRDHDLVIDAAMISDVPGYTWGLVPVLVQSGIKYLSIGPNHIHRIGRTLDAWGDRPFWWVSPSGEERLLCWMAGKAYSWFHDSRAGVLTRDSDPSPFFGYLQELIDEDYPYDMVQVRYSIGGDNGPPDQELSEFVKRWNETYEWPRMAITTTSQLLREFEHRYGDQLPEVRGDFTPYWEDGAASSAEETSLARVAAERIVQAETIWSLLQPDAFPHADFEDAWREVILYNEHTWGAHCSITQPDSEFTLSQWAIKQAFALRADEKSRELLGRAWGADDPLTGSVSAVDVYNTSSWPRTDLVVLNRDLPLTGHVVRDERGQVVPSQVVRHSGQLAFLAADVPALGAKRFWIESGNPPSVGSVQVAGNVLRHDSLRVELDPHTGAISSLKWDEHSRELVDPSQGHGLAQYHYVAGRRPVHPQTSHSARIQTTDEGGLIGGLMAVAEAPGSRGVRTLVRIVDGLDRVDVTVMLDKEKVLEPEGVHIGFPFQVPNGQMRVDIPWAVMRPNVDQLPGACKNYLTVGRWVDLSNDQFGVTWTTRDAPLLEVGGIHMDVDKPFDAASWVAELEPTQTFYSYVMNNYWETNYKASQEGLVAFHYSLMPHQQFDQVASMKFGLERSQPLIAKPVRPDAPQAASSFTVEPASVLVTSMTPSHDGQAMMVRLFNAGDQLARARLIGNANDDRQIFLSSPLEEVGDVVTGAVEMLPLGIVTLRVSP